MEDTKPNTHHIPPVLNELIFETRQFKEALAKVPEGDREKFLLAMQVYANDFYEKIIVPLEAQIKTLATK